MLDAAIIQQIPPGSTLNTEEDIYVRAFTHVYRDQPHLNNPGRLRKVFKIARRDFFDPSFHFYRALYEDHPIGFIAFRPTDDPYEVHVAHLAIDPNFQRLGVGKHLLLSIFDLLPTTKKLVLITRKENLASCAFYQKLGFTPSDFSDDDYDMDAFTGFELLRND